MKKLFVLFISFLFIWACEKPKQQNNLLEIGVLLPLTGDMASYGISAKEGVELAVKSINDMSKNKINIHFEDTKGQPKEAVNACLKIITSIKNIAGIIGPQTSSEVLSIAPICEKHKIPLISHAASSPQITNAGEYIFRNVPSDYYEATVMADYIIDSTEYRNVATIYINSDYGKGVIEKFIERFTQKGGTVATSISYNSNSTDFKTQLTKLKYSKPQAIYFIGYKELGYLIKQSKELNINLQYYSNALFEDPEILKIAGSSANDVIFTTFYFDIKSKEKRIQDFIKNYKEKYDKVPDGFAATAYDAVYLIYEAAKSGISPASIKNGLYKIKDFPGLLGTLNFDSNGDVTLPVQLKTVKNGNFINLSQGD